MSAIFFGDDEAVSPYFLVSLLSKVIADAINFERFDKFVLYLPHDKMAILWRKLTGVCSFSPKPQRSLISSHNILCVLKICLCNKKRQKLAFCVFLPSLPPLPLPALSSPACRTLPVTILSETDLLALPFLNSQKFASMRFNQIIIILRYRDNNFLECGPLSLAQA